MDPPPLKAFRKQRVSFLWGRVWANVPRCPPCAPGQIPMPRRPGPHVISSKDKPGKPSDDLLSLQGYFSVSGSRCSQASGACSALRAHGPHGSLWLMGLSPAACRPVPRAAGPRRRIGMEPPRTPSSDENIKVIYQCIV